MTAPLSPSAFAALAELLKTRSGLVIGLDKTYLLETRLSPILKRAGAPDLNALADRVKRSPNDPLARDVVEAMTTNESFFFRDDKPFQHFKMHTLPRLLAARPGGANLRIWSAASSSGQEAYSLAMILAEAKAQLGARTVEIVGTDIARDQLARAQQQDFGGSTRLVRRQRLFHEFAQRCVQRAHVAQGLADQGAGKTGIADFQARQLVQLRVQGAALLQHARQNGECSLARGKSGIFHGASLEAFSPKAHA